MTQGKFSEGPYYVRTSDLCPDELLVLADETCIAAVQIWENVDEGDEMEEQSRANASLLAASWDLLEALEAVAVIHCNHADGECSVTDMVRAAIAKAKDGVS